MPKISVSDAKSHFSEFLFRAASGERFVILRRKRPLATIIGFGELARLERSAEIARRLVQTLGQSPKLLEGIESGKAHPAMAAYSLWKDQDDLANIEETVKQNLQRSFSQSKVK